MKSPITPLLGMFPKYLGIYRAPVTTGMWFGLRSRCWQEKLDISPTGVSGPQEQPR